MLDTEIIKGIGYLKQKQLTDGSFSCYLFPSKEKAGKKKKLPTSFITSLITLCLLQTDTSKEKDTILSHSTAYLLQQKSPTWSWNYWKRSSSQYKKYPYPDDLDDTFCACQALYLHDKTLFTGEVFGHLVHLLTEQEEQEGGPYKTWIVPNDVPDVWKDVDPAVNANIGYFLSLQEIELPNLSSYIQDIIDRDKYSSIYYVSEFPIIYFLSRWISGKQRDHLIEYLISKQLPDDSWGNDLSTALAVSSLLALQTPLSHVKKSIRVLQSHQSKDGSFPMAGFYKDRGPDNTSQYVAGSSELTTAIAIEAFARFRKESQKKAPSNKHKHQSTENILAKEITDQVISELNSWSQEGYKATSPIISELLTHDTSKQLVLLPFFFWSSIDPAYTKQINNPTLFLKQLGKATLYGWIAYTIFDNILDNEPNPLHLSSALFSLRKLTLLFTHSIQELSELPVSVRYKRQASFSLLFTSTMDKLDAANQWEVLCSRCSTTTPLSRMSIPVYTEIHTKKQNRQSSVPSVAHRSLGHALGPLAILYALGLPSNDIQIHKTISLFIHYLTARQLNDDAHDWEEDLSQGRINAVGAYILSYFQQNHPTSKKTIADLLNSLELKTLFWDTLIPSVSQTIEDICYLGEKDLSQIQIIYRPEIFLSLFAKQKAAAIKAREQQQHIHQFLTTLR